MSDFSYLISKDGTTTSQIVAQHFEKRHANVLRSIDDLGCSEEFRRLNFEPTYFVDSRGIEQRVVNLTKDGFSMVVMGFTGAKAVEWKEKFLKAFNMMEQHIRDELERKAKRQPVQPRPTTTWRNRLPPGPNRLGNQDVLKSEQEYQSAIIQPTQLPEEGQPVTYLDTARGQLTALNQMCNALEYIVREQEETNRRVFSLEEHTRLLRNQVDEIRPRDGYMTVAAFAHHYNIRFTSSESLDLGRTLARLCRERGMEVDHVPDRRFGKVNAYPSELFDELLEEYQ